MASNRRIARKVKDQLTTKVHKASEVYPCIILLFTSRFEGVSESQEMCQEIGDSRVFHDLATSNKDNTMFEMQGSFFRHTRGGSPV